MSPASVAEIRSAPPAPRLAVVIPIFRHSTLLGEAIESVLQQRAEFAIRLILVNDGCPHRETEAVCLDYARSYPDRVVYLRKPNGGLSDARNFGIRHVLAREPDVEAIYLLDADNRLRPHAMARAMAALEADPTLGWIYPNIDMFGLAWNGDFGGAYSRLIHSSMNISEAGSLISRKVFEAGVMFDTSFKQGFEDWEFFLSAGAAGFRGANVEDFGFLYRKRPESMLADSEREGAGIRAAMERKHKALLQPRSLVALEQAELPRYAFFLVDRREIRITTDPTQPGETISIDDYDRRVWLSISNPSRYHVPPFVVVTTSEMLALFTRFGLLHGLLWRLEGLAEDADVSTLSVGWHDAERMSVNVQETTGGKHLQASVLMLRSSLLHDILRDSMSVWIDSLMTATPLPTVAGLMVELPGWSDEPAYQAGGSIASQLLALIHRLRASIWRDGALTPMEWRTGGIQLRGESHLVLRERVGQKPAYPRVPDAKLHIGLTIPLVEFGGVEKVALNYARELKAQGVCVHLFILAATEAAITPDWRDAVDSVNFLQVPGINEWDQRQPAFLGTKIPGWSQTGDHGWLLGSLYWLDVVIDFHGGAAAAVMGKLKKLGVRTATSLHVADLSPMGRPVGNCHLAVAYEHAFDVFAPCSLQLADWLHAIGVPQDKIVPVPNAPPFPISDAHLARCLADRRARDHDEPLRVMYLGRLDPQKGLGRLAQVVEGSADLNVEWRIIGKAVVDGPDGGVPRSVAAALEPPIWTAKELAEAYAWADVVVLLSEYEGLPLTVLEAMRQGAVMVATDVGAVSEVLRDGENGVLLPLESAVEGCLSALRRLSRDRDLLRRLSATAVRDMERRTWDSALAGFVGQLEALTDAQAPTESTARTVSDR